MRPSLIFSYLMVCHSLHLNFPLPAYARQSLTAFQPQTLLCCTVHLQPCESKILCPSIIPNAKMYVPRRVLPGFPYVWGNFRGYPRDSNIFQCRPELDPKAIRQFQEYLVGHGRCEPLTPLRIKGFKRVATCFLQGCSSHLLLQGCMQGHTVNSQALRGCAELQKRIIHICPVGVWVEQ
jgi:hypothetical protein